MTALHPSMKRARKARRRIARLKVFRREGADLKPEWLELRPTEKLWAYGRAGRTGWVYVPREPHCQIQVEHIILHEMTHVCLYRIRHPQRNGHGQAFRGLLLAAAEEYWGVDGQWVLRGWEHRKGRAQNLAYDLDQAIIAQVRADQPLERAASENPNRTRRPR